jgi:hypothetical protein
MACSNAERRTGLPFVTGRERLRSLTAITWSGTICPDGATSDNNDGNNCIGDL